VWQRFVEELSGRGAGNGPGVITDLARMLQLLTEHASRATLRVMP